MDGGLSNSRHTGADLRSPSTLEQERLPFRLLGALFHS
jgi:hypothetical protein